MDKHYRQLKDQGALGQCEYDSNDDCLLPFYTSDFEIAESDANAADKEKILKDLTDANKKRKLKNLKRFLCNRYIIEMAFDRCIKHASKSPELIDVKTNKDKIISRIQTELSNQTYHPKQCYERTIIKHGNGDKPRHATIFHVYDRIVQNVFLLTIQQKIHNCFIRNIYSGITGRCIWANDKRYCMGNQIRQWVKTHPDDYAVTTDIRQFYQSLNIKVAIERLKKIIKCEYACWLLDTMFMHVTSTPIGGPLSQMMAMLAIQDGDIEILRRYNIVLFCFGDNRLIGGSKKDVLDAKDYLMNYYSSLGLEMKNDYQLHKVKDGFRFCKSDYYRSFVTPRSEFKRRAIHGYNLGQQHYAGYHGILIKTDSKHFRHMLQHEHKTLVLRNKQGMIIPRFLGQNHKLRDVESGTKICIVDYIKLTNENKGNEYYKIQYLMRIKDSEQEHLFSSSEGSFEIKQFFELVDSGQTDIPQWVTVQHEGNKIYFEEFHTNYKEACQAIIDAYNIKYPI